MKALRHCSKLPISILLVLAIVLATWTCPSLSGAHTGTEPVLAREKLAGIALPFIANQGQYPKEVAFSALTFGSAVFVTNKGEVVYSLPGQAQDITLLQQAAGTSDFLFLLIGARKGGLHHPLQYPDEPQSQGVVLQEYLIGSKVRQVSSEGIKPTKVQRFI